MGNFSAWSGNGGPKNPCCGVETALFRVEWKWRSSTCVSSTSVGVPAHSTTRVCRASESIATIPIMTGNEYRPMAAGTPRFGPKLDPDEHKSHMKNLEAEMYRFADDKKGRDRYANILHLGTDLGAARPETDRIVKFMRGRGYEVEHENRPEFVQERGDVLGPGSDADILILGNDKASRESAATYCSAWVLVGSGSCRTGTCCGMYGLQPGTTCGMAQTAPHDT